MSKGWIKLHRQIMNHPFYEEERTFSRHEAWEYLLLNANHADNKALIDGKMVTVERGSFITSIRKLQERWKWSNTKVTQFLELLEYEEMITRESDTKKTLITVDKYDFYQGEGDEKKTPERHENDTETIQKHTNKNLRIKEPKNERSEKTLYAPNVALTDDEYQRLCSEFGEDSTKMSIEYLSSYKLEKNYKTKSDNLTIRRWVMEAVNKSKVVMMPRNNQPSYLRTKSKLEQMQAEAEAKEREQFGHHQTGTDTFS